MADNNKAIPEVIKSFLPYFHRNIKENNTSENEKMYEETFPALTDRFYREESWPSPSLVAPFFDNDKLSGYLYSELYFRHIYSKLKPTLQQRFDSWQNYLDLFSFFLQKEKEEEVVGLPEQWVWDMIDEFIYQFQNYCQYRSKFALIKAEEVQSIKERPDVWHISGVSRLLQSFIDKPSSLPSNSNTSFYYYAGYFSAIGLMRVYSLIGDFYQALKSIDSLDLSKKGFGVYSKVPACHISLFYYMGYSYLIMRRYVDVIKTFTKILLHFSRSEHQTFRFAQVENAKKIDQMYALLAIAISLSPQPIDESVYATMKEKFPDRLSRAIKGDENAFEEFFMFASPKFISPSLPSFDDPSSSHSNNNYLLNQHLKLFMNEVRQQAAIPTIRSYLKLYTSIPLSKLSSFLSLNENQLISTLLSIKHKTNAVTWTGGAALSGTKSSSSNIEFFIDNDMISITDTKFGGNSAKTFLNFIDKYEDIVSSLDSASI